jgi:hypothetical protein
MNSLAGSQSDYLRPVKRPDSILRRGQGLRLDQAKRMRADGVVH